MALLFLARCCLMQYFSWLSCAAHSQVVVNGKTALDMSSLNFLGIAGSSEVRLLAVLPGWPPAIKLTVQKCQRGRLGSWVSLQWPAAHAATGEQTQCVTCAGMLGLPLACRSGRRATARSRSTAWAAAALAAFMAPLTCTCSWRWVWLGSLATAAVGFVC